MNNIIMNVDMAKATAGHYKTTTRRIIKNSESIPNILTEVEKLVLIDMVSKYVVDEILWIREPAIVTNYISRFDGAQIDYQLKSNNKKEYRIDLPKRFFPNPKKWITKCKSVPNGCISEMAKQKIRITNIRVERLQDIGYDDISLEGFDNTYKDCSGLSYEERRFDWWINLWNSTAPEKYQWEANPYVFVYDFELV